MKKYICGAMLLFAASTFNISCTTENETGLVSEEGMEISILSYTFNNSAENLTVNVKSDNAWEAKSEGDWVSVEKTDDNTAVISVTENILKEMRSSNVVFSDGKTERTMKVEQLSSTFKGKFREISDAVSAAISRNGKFVACVKIIGYDEIYGNEIYSAALINIETGEETVIQLDEDYPVNEVAAVSDDGTKIIFKETMYNLCTSVWEKGEWSNLGKNDQQFVAEAASSDLSVVVGYAEDEDGKIDYRPWKITNGEFKYIEYPIVTVEGKPVLEPEIINPGDGGDPLEFWHNGGTLARGCSADGSVVYGSEWDKKSLVYWKNDEMVFIAKQEYDNTEDHFNINMAAKQNTAISQNGKYIVSNAKNINGMTSGVCVDTDSKTVRYIQADAMFFTVDDNGNIFGATPSLWPSSGVVLKAGSEDMIKLSDWFKEKGVSISNDRYIKSISTDGKTLLGSHALNNGFRMIEIPFYVCFE